MLSSVLIVFMDLICHSVCDQDAKAQSENIGECNR